MTTANRIMRVNDSAKSKMCDEESTRQMRRGDRTESFFKDGSSILQIGPTFKANDNRA